MSGASQNSQSCASAQPPAKTATPVGKDVGRGEAAARPQADRDRRVEVAAGNVPDRVGHGEHAQAEGERDAEKPDAELGEGRREHGAPESR
jgi:hypothetical protein